MGHRPEGSGAEPLHSRTDQIGEESENLALVRVATGRGLAVQHLPVDSDVEDSLATGDKAEIRNNVLVVGQQIPGHAHGVIGIVSRNAVGDFDRVAHVRHDIGRPTGIAGRLSRGIGRWPLLWGP